MEVATPATIPAVVPPEEDEETDAFINCSPVRAPSVVFIVWSLLSNLKECGVAGGLHSPSLVDKSSRDALAGCYDFLQ